MSFGEIVRVGCGLALKRPRWHVHYTPTDASWVNQYKRFFVLINEHRIPTVIYHFMANYISYKLRLFEFNNNISKIFIWNNSFKDNFS